jgi:exodeoxyribonuclease VIII
MIQESSSEYHANAAVSHSKLETFRRRPALYHKRYIAKQIVSEEPSAAFRIGSAVHCSVLEPAEWSKRYAIKPEGIDRRTKEGKERWAQFEQQNGGKTIIDQDESALVLQMTDAVRHNPLAAQLLGRGVPEATWRTGGTITLQCRTDWFNPDGCELTEGRAYVADLKTVESLDDETFSNFERAVFRFGYHRQAGFYLPLISELWAKPVFDFFFLAVEKCEPFGVAVFRLTDDAVSLGQDETIADLRDLKRCIDFDVWPNIDAVVRELGVPAWYTKGLTP